MMDNMDIARRSFLAGAAASALLVLPGCESYRRFSLIEAIRRLLMLSTQNALARLAAPGGFWDNQLARLALPEIFGSRGSALQRILTSALLRDRLQRALNHVAERGADHAAPIIADVVRTIGIENAAALVKGEPTAATDFLRSSMKGSLVEAMVPAMGDALQVADDPIVGQAIAALTNVDVSAVARSLSVQVEDVIWAEIGREETAIRANPEKTRDPVLIGVFGVL